MGRKGRFKENRWQRFKEPIFHKLISRNKYSKYIDFSGFNGEEAMILQSQILADLGDTIEQQTDMNVDNIIEMFSCFFECAFKKIKAKPPKKNDTIIWKWKGVECKKLQDELLGYKDRPSAHEIGSELALISKRNTLIERRMKANKYYYLANGYRSIMRIDIN